MPRRISSPFIETSLFGLFLSSRNIVQIGEIRAGPANSYRITFLQYRTIDGGNQVGGELFEIRLRRGCSGNVVRQELGSEEGR